MITSQVKKQYDKIKTRMELNMITSQTKKQYDRIKRIMGLEDSCSTKFLNMGWEVGENTDSSKMADFYLSYKGAVIGYIDIKMCDDLQQYFKQMKRNRGFLEHLYKRYIQLFQTVKPTSYFFTNGFQYDLYIFGNYYCSLTSPPSPEDLLIIVEKLKNEGGNNNDE